MRCNTLHGDARAEIKGQRLRGMDYFATEFLTVFAERGHALRCVNGGCSTRVVTISHGHNSAGNFQEIL